MSTEVRNDKLGWSREVEDLGNGAVYVCDSTINSDGSMSYHEYNVYENGTHTHVSGELTKDGELIYNGGHGEEKRPWHW